MLGTSWIPNPRQWEYAGNKPITFIDLDGNEEDLPPLAKQVQKDFQSFLKQGAGQKPASPTFQGERPNQTFIGPVPKENTFVKDAIIGVSMKVLTETVNTTIFLYKLAAGNPNDAGFSSGRETPTIQDIKSHNKTIKDIVNYWYPTNFNFHEKWSF